MELFERLRREYEFGIGTVKGVARTFGVHRRMVRQAVEGALPPLRGYRPRAKPALEPLVDPPCRVTLLARSGRIRCQNGIDERHHRFQRRLGAAAIAT